MQTDGQMSFNVPRFRIRQGKISRLIRILCEFRKDTSACLLISYLGFQKFSSFHFIILIMLIVCLFLYQSTFLFANQRLAALRGVISHPIHDDVIAFFVIPSLCPIIVFFSLQLFIPLCLDLNETWFICCTKISNCSYGEIINVRKYGCNT